MIFVDTSAFIAIIIKNDAHHKDAAKIWVKLLNDDNNKLFTTNYILLETKALLQSKLGIEAVKVFANDILPSIQIDWITEEIHKSALSALLLANRNKLSLVDCTSFEVMNRRYVKTAFSFDKHFKEQGFLLC